MPIDFLPLPIASVLYYGVQLACFSATFSVLLLWVSGGGCKSCAAVCFWALAVVVCTLLIPGAPNLLWIS